MGCSSFFEAAYNEGQPPPNLTEAALSLLEQARSRGFLAYEQYQDFLKLRRFRQSLVTHAAVPLVRDAPARAMPKFHFAAPLQRSAAANGAEFNNQKSKVGATVTNPVIIEALDRIGRAWPSTVPFNGWRTMRRRASRCSR